ncbi:MAG: transglycosylase SLT domain-containing protein [Buchnera aphidicola (Nurudea shiraii)]
MILCSGFKTFEKNPSKCYEKQTYNYFCKINFVNFFSKIIQQSSKKYNVDPNLVKSIICVESSGNIKAISRSKAIGLMQIKQFSAGKEVYRFQGKSGQPSIYDLYNPKTNIEIGTAYIHILQEKNLSGIHNLEILRYATIVSYSNGPNMLLKIFSNNRLSAIKKINKLKKQEFLNYIKKNTQNCKLGNILKKL